MQANVAQQANAVLETGGSSNSCCIRAIRPSYCCCEMYLRGWPQHSRRQWLRSCVLSWHWFERLAAGRKSRRAGGRAGGRAVRTEKTRTDRASTAGSRVCSSRCLSTLLRSDRGSDKFSPRCSYSVVYLAAQRCQALASRRWCQCSCLQSPADSHQQQASKCMLRTDDVGRVIKQ
jgi:hypothetical protein